MIMLYLIRMMKRTRKMVKLAIMNSDCNDEEEEQNKDDIYDEEDDNQISSMVFALHIKILRICTKLDGKGVILLNFSNTNKSPKGFK